MATDDDLVLLSRVLEPFDAPAPAGVDLRHDAAPLSIWSRLRDARAEARAEERALDNEVVSQARWPAGWTVVETLAVEALSQHSKDLEIASWLAESLTRRRGLPGLALAASIMAGLVERFWNHGLYPSADPADPEARLFAVSGLSGADRDGSLMQPLRKLVLFDASDGQPVSLWQYERSRSVAALSDAARKQQYEKGRVLNFDALEIAARGMGRATLLAVGHGEHAARMSWMALEEALSQAEPGATPSTGRVRALLEGIEQIVRRYIPDIEMSRTPAAATETHAQQDDDAGETDVAEETAAPGAPVGRRTPSREELLDEILKIAVLFREGEPNSPLSFTLEEAVRRARLSLPELLRELMPELSSRSNLLTQLGIRAPDA